MLGINGPGPRRRWPNRAVKTAWVVGRQVDLFEKSPCSSWLSSAYRLSVGSPGLPDSDLRGLGSSDSTHGRDAVRGTGTIYVRAVCRLHVHPKSGWITRPDPVHIHTMYITTG